MWYKLRDKQGFTLVESLAAVVAVMLLAAILAVCLSAATQVFKKSVFVSESEILAASLNTELSNILRYSKGDIDDEGTVRFSNASYMAEDAYFSVDDYIYLNEDAIEGTQDATSVNLVNRGTYTSLVIKDFFLEYNIATRVFTGGYTIQMKDDPSLNKAVMFSFKSLAYASGP